MTAHEPAVPSGFVGRTGELDALDRALGAARGGASGLLLVAGDGGFGKTRLLEEFARRCGLPRERVLWGRCPEQRGAPAFWPWSQVLGALVDALDDDELRLGLAPVAAPLARVVPEVCRRLGVEAAGDAEPEADNRFRTFGGVARLLAHASEAEPVALLFDDVHFADGASLALLGFLAQELSDARVLMVAAYRPREMRRTGEPVAWMARAREHVTLGGFDRDEVVRFVESRSGAPCSPEVAGRLHEVTDGHPFFLDELVRVLRTGRELSDGPMLDVRGRLPAGARAAIEQRLSPLSGTTRRTIDLAAVLGRTFDLRTLEIACERPAPTLLEDLSEATACGIVEESSEAPSRFRFSHALIREAVYGDLLPAARAAAHRRVALALEQRSAADVDPPLAELAHHFYYSAALGDAAKATDYCVRAAARALALGAYEESVAHYQRALQAMGMQPPDEARHLELRLALAFSSWRAGSERQARETFLRAADTARSMGDAVALARAAMGYNTATALTGGIDDGAARLLEDALRALGDADAPLRSLVLSSLSMRLYFTAERAREKDLARTALEMSERLGDPVARAVALLAEHFAHWEPDALETRREIAERLVASGHAAGPALALEARMWRIVDALEAGDLATVDVDLELLARRAEEHGLARWVAQASFMRAMRALLAARFDEAERSGAHAVAVRPAEDQNNAEQFRLVQAFAARRDRGGLGELEADVERMVAKHPALPVWRAGLALLRAVDGRADEARVLLEQMTARSAAPVPRDSNWLPTIALLAEVASVVGDAERAAVLADLLAPYAARTVVMATGIGCYGSVARYAGLAAATAGRTEDAERLLTAALVANERLGAPALVARTRCDLGLVLLEPGPAHDAGRGARLLDEARAAAERHALAGLGGVLARAPLGGGAVGDAADPPAARGVPPDAEDRSALFQREGDYWKIAHGAAEFRLRHSKGFDYLVVLLRHPGHEFHVLDLASHGEPTGTPAPGDAVAGALRVGGPGDAGDLLDAKARAVYRERLAELRDELEEARGFNDPERAARAERELEFLADELARGVGLGGRSRKAASAAERARQNLSRTIGAVVRRIAAESPILGQYLVATVHTGAFCSYDPDPRAPIRWIL